jgi:YHS domain-containing protein
MLKTTTRATALAVTLLLALGAFAIATTPNAAAQKVISAPEIYTASREKIAVSGYDPVAYFVTGTPTKGQATLTAVHQGVTWRFANEPNRTAFLADPAKYAPQYGGYCAYAVSQGYTASADPTVWEIVDGKLYLNYSRSVGTSWSKQSRSYIKSGDNYWAQRKPVATQ